MYNPTSRKIAVIGLGYVGLPVAVAFAQHNPVIAYDKNSKRIKELRSGHDSSREVTTKQLAASQLLLTDNPDDLADADFYIVAVPTPVNQSKHPDLSLLLNASETIGKHLKQGDIVVYESTVYPGATENDCAPVLEAASGLTCGSDFTLGYSPERINPGDTEHRFENITKIVAGQDEKTLDIIADVYGSVVTAGIYRAPDIKTAEAAKVIENTQRDINIALMNELAIIFDRMHIDTQEVLKAAGTKWNFLPFTPGLVGGHCIGVDPYYLTYQAQRYGYQPEVILSGRRINDHVGKHIAEQTIKHMIHKGYTIKGAKVAVLGLTFKKNCPDLRNTKVIDIIRELNDYGIECLVHDPIADADVAKQLYDVDLKSWDDIQNVDAIVLAVAHDQYQQYSIAQYHAKMANHSIIVDVKGVLNKQECQENGIQLWRL
ncbi:nucleotide sugar dehydrogenase [Candidiatus Paracoxiella cheracis]|uniref:nucleotide sugar dehydrogenase n=1 Tax=Candidiatus Paracoxiella cheracis TaxID=3405120 RepID=UPI003BF5DC88